MGRVPEPHTSPKAPEDRPWNWHGPAEADKSDAIVEAGGWTLLADAHAWYDPTADEEGRDPPHEKQAYKLPHHELVDGRLRVVWHGGGVDIPESDRNKVYDHLAEHCHEFDREPPPFH